MCSLCVCDVGAVFACREENRERVRVHDCALSSGVAENGLEQKERAHEAEVTEAVDKRARETERLFRAILECPLAARTRWRLLSASALPRLTFLLRNHAAKHTRGAAEWFDARVTAVLSAIVGRPVSQRARDVAALPIAMGGCGLRRQVTIAEFAHECVGHKNLQRSKTEEADRDLSNALFATVYGAERQVLTANAAAGAGRALTDPQVCTDDAAFCTYVLERLLERVLPDGQKCVCGADASNWHVHTCTKLHGKPRQLRHDVANSKLALGLRLCGFDCTTEPHLNEVSKRRPDLLITGLGTQAVTDVTVTHPAVHPRGGKRSDSHSGIMTYEEAQAVYNPVHSAKVRYQEKCRKYAHWASQNGLNFAPFVLLTNGAVYEQSRTWLRKVIASHDHRLTVTTAYDFVTGDVVAAVLRGNVHVFAVAGSGSGCEARAG
ncbi:hypothetical protein ERJ75_001301700 [Trypanosoma vivax]|nr:hypothetical protein ERJ75_001301700 [Trypanosoma vivax]